MPAPAEPSQLAASRLTDLLAQHPTGTLSVEASDLRLLLGRIETLQHVAHRNQQHVGFLYQDLTTAQRDRDAASDAVAGVEALAEQMRAAGPGNATALLAVRLSQALRGTPSDAAAPVSERACHECGHPHAVHLDELGDQCLHCPPTGSQWRHAFAEWPSA